MWCVLSRSNLSYFYSVLSGVFFPLCCFVVPPSVVGDLEVPENISAVEKNPVALICEASGIPLPSITWLKNGRPVPLNSSVRILSGTVESLIY